MTWCDQRFKESKNMKNRYKIAKAQYKPNSLIRFKWILFTGMFPSGAERTNFLPPKITGGFFSTSLTKKLTLHQSFSYTHLQRQNPLNTCTRQRYPSRGAAKGFSWVLPSPSSLWYSRGAATPLCHSSCHDKYGGTWVCSKVSSTKHVFTPCPYKS